MKFKLSYILITGITLISCEKEDSGIEQLHALEKNNRVYEAHYSNKKEPNTAWYASVFPLEIIDPIKANGLEPIVYFGDTIGYQCYKNGIKHGPYFSMLNKRSIMDGNVVPDGMYDNGHKDGFFYRYRNIDDLHYVAYYEDNQLIWADHYFQMELYPKYPFALKRKHFYVDVKHPNGVTWFKGEYRNKKPHGVHKYYYTDGNKRGEIDYSSNEVREFYYYDNKVDTSIYEFDMEDVYSENGGF